MKKQSKTFLKSLFSGRSAVDGVAVDVVVIGGAVVDVVAIGGVAVGGFVVDGIDIDSDAVDGMTSNLIKVTIKKLLSFFCC